MLPPGTLGCALRGETRLRLVSESSVLDGAGGVEDVRVEGEILGGDRIGCIIVLIPLVLLSSDLEGRGGDLCFMVAASFA